MSRHSYSASLESDSNNRLPELLTSGIAEKKIRIAMRHDASGSHPFQELCFVSKVLIITATDPRASARM